MERGCITDVFFLKRSSHTWWLGEANFPIWTHISTCMDTCMDLDWDELRGVYIILLENNRRIDIFGWAKSQPLESCASESCLCSQTKQGHGCSLAQRPSGTVAWFASYTQILFLPIREWPCLQFLWGTAPWLVFVSNPTEALLGETLFGTGQGDLTEHCHKQKRWSYAIVWVWSWSFLVCWYRWSWWYFHSSYLRGLWLSYFLGQSHTQILILVSPKMIYEVGSP